MEGESVREVPTSSATAGPDLAHHLDLVGILSIVVGSLAIAAAAVGFLFATLAMAIAAPWDGSPALSGVMTGVLGVLLLGTVGAGILGILGGLDLRRRRLRGRTLVMILAVFSLFSFPVGTAFGVYALWVLTRPGIEAALGQTSTVTP